ncbi:Uu.00g000200.m01.CDS01 [Anthostomella pinea]|uniref:Uu.00g000200.m01.CDS01 n=1 Tax=Anthostomella pinea TaxID=933095 RepID=A0AAI8VK42_9PEZI|nr:Uu.00g000200.m01.CDS01 [Anthostomella pinea]
MTADQAQQDLIVLSMPPAKKSPLLVFTAAAAAGHTSQPLQLARELVGRGHDVVFMSSTEFRAGVEKAGAEWFECPEFLPAAHEAARQGIPPGPPRMLYDMHHLFIDGMIERAARMRALLEMVREREPEREVIVFAEAASMVMIPFFHGAPLPRGYAKLPKAIGLGVVPLVVRSDDTAPFGPGVPPDASESGRARNNMLYDLMYGGPFKSSDDHFRQVLRDQLGCTREPDGFMFDIWFKACHTMFQMCSPSMDYPRHDLDLRIRYAGALPPRPLDPAFALPSWWAEITANAALPPDSPDRKKVVSVSQGTVNFDYSELLLPTLQGLADRADVLVVAILGSRGATLPPDAEVPANARVVDYLPYDAILAHADVSINNGGFGGFVHGAVNGVPLVLAGVTEDKVEVSAMAEYSGMAVNLKTQRPTPEAVAEAVGRILEEPKFKRRAMRLRQDNRDLDTVNLIEKQILEYAAEG